MTCRKCDCLNDCGDDPALHTGQAEYCDRAKKQIADIKAAKERRLREIMKLVDAYAEARINASGAAQAREALKAKIKELIDAQV